MTEEVEQPETIIAELKRLWKEAKAWEEKGFPGNPIVVRLRDHEAQAKPVGLREETGKREQGLMFRLTWKSTAGDCYVDLFIDIQPKGGPKTGPSGGVRILAENPASRTEGDIYWGAFKDLKTVSMDIVPFCQQQIERACRHKNENKFFRYKQAVAK